MFFRELTEILELLKKRPIEYQQITNSSVTDATR
jgi:hypothetical protein